MINNLKVISRNYALKAQTGKLSRKCTTIKFTKEFYENLIKLQEQNIIKLFRKKDLHINPEFCINTFKINTILKNQDIDLFIFNKLTDNLTVRGVKSDSDFLKLFSTFFENIKSNPDHPITKELLKVLERNKFFFDNEERKKIEKMLKNDNKEKEEVEVESNKKLKIEDIQDTPEKNGNDFVQQFVKIKLKDDSTKLYLDTGNKKATFKSKHFLSKIKIIGLDDNKSEKILNAFNYVDKNRPNTLILQKRPILFQQSTLYGVDDMDELMDSHYKSLLEREDIINYCKNYLTKKPQFKINNVERLVYEQVDSNKTISYMQSLILKSNYSLNLNPQIKVVLADVPLFKEIEFIYQNIFNKIDPKDLFVFMKLSFLFEKYLWLIENCQNECPSCNKDIRFEFAHLSLEVLIDDYLLSIFGIEHLRVKNIADKIIQSVKFGDFKGNNIVAFIEEKYFYYVIERLVKDFSLISEGKNFEEAEKLFTELNENYKKDFNFKIGNFDNLIVKDESGIKNKNEFLNKFAIVLNIFQNKKIIEGNDKLPEINLLNDDLLAPLYDLYKVYEEKLNYSDEIRLWKGKKYDYKCYPNEILINKYINK
jgi:hypothetical protein